MENRNDLNKKQKAKLSERKNVFDKYGKLPFKEGYFRKKLGYDSNLQLSDYDVHQSGGVTSRSKSVINRLKMKGEPKKRNQSYVEVDSAAE